MKTLLSLLFSFLFLSSQAQYTVDWSKAPLNPLPEVYTINHYQLAGNVLSRTTNGETSINFNEAGNAVSESDEYNNATYIYDNLGHIAQMKIGGFADLTINYKTNKMGFVTTITYDNGSTHFVEYNEKGLYIAKRVNDEPLEKYAYDPQDRVIKREFFVKGKPSNTYTYTYTEAAEGLTVIETKVNKASDIKVLDTIKFNKRGDVVLREKIRNEYQYDSHNNIISGNVNGYPVVFEYVYAEK